MGNKNRILYLLQYLQSHSDEDCPVTTAQVRAALAEKGCPATIETLRDDVAALRAAGYDIAVNESSGLTTTYSWLDRPFDDPELQILIDAVSASQFISRTRSRRLIGKLAAMAGPTRRGQLGPGIMVSEYVKTPNSQLLYTVQRISEAVQADRKIAFQYYRFNLEKRRVPRQDGKWYVISPYITVWKQERYFLVGHSQERGRVVVFRVDRMGVPRLTEEPRVPAPGDFDPTAYTERVFNMYDDGVMETVTLRCRTHMIDHIIDYFGKGVTPENITPDGFDVRVRVSLSPTFYAWVLGYVGDMTIVGPEHVFRAYREALQRGIDEAELAREGRFPRRGE